MKKHYDAMDGVVGAVFTHINRDLYLAMNRNRIINQYKRMTGKYEYMPFFSFPDDQPGTILVKLISPSVVEDFKNHYGDEYENKLNETFGRKG